MQPVYFSFHANGKFVQFFQRKKTPFASSLDVIITNDRPWKMKHCTYTNDKHSLWIGNVVQQYHIYIMYPLWKFSCPLIFSCFVYSMMHLLLLAKALYIFLLPVYSAFLCSCFEYILTLLWLLFWRFPANSFVKNLFIKFHI